jgi:hypothetical protein
MERIDVGKSALEDVGRYVLSSDGVLCDTFLIASHLIEMIN